MLESEIPQRTEAAFHAWRDAVKVRKTIADTIKQAQETDSALADVAKEKKEAAESYKAELEQFKLRHDKLYSKLDGAKAEMDAAKGTFDEMYLAAQVEAGQGNPVQLSLIDDGKTFGVELTTRVKAKKAEKAAIAEEIEAA